MTTTKPLHERVAQNIRAAVEEQHASISYLVDETGIADRTLRRRLSGRSPFGTDELELIAEALGIDPLDLMRP